MLKQFGVGLATAVLIDATIVRLVLLPAAMRLFGETTGGRPTWLDEQPPGARRRGRGVRAREPDDAPAAAPKWIRTPPANPSPAPRRPPSPIPGSSRHQPLTKAPSSSQRTAEPTPPAARSTPSETTARRTFSRKPPRRALAAASLPHQMRFARSGSSGGPPSSSASAGVGEPFPQEGGAAGLDQLEVAAVSAVPRGRPPRASGRRDG